MFVLKFLMVVVSSFQLTTCILAQDNVKDDAQKSLNLLSNQVEDAKVVVSIGAPEIWRLYLSNISSTVNYYLQNDTNDFTFVLSNISAIAVNVPNAAECMEPLMNLSGSVARFTSEEIIYDKLLSLAQVDVSNAASQYSELRNGFVRNCVQNETNCEGTSKAIVAEVERLLPKVKRISVELLMDVHVLGYKLAVALESVHTELMETYNKAVQSATLCLVSEIKGHRQDSALHPVPSAPFFNWFSDLITITGATSPFVRDILTREREVSHQTTADFLISVKRMGTALLKAESTRNSLVSTAEHYNIKLNCSKLDLASIHNSSFNRIRSEFYILQDIFRREFSRRVRDIIDIGHEPNYITMQIKLCLRSKSCDYLAEKVAVMKYEVPWRMQQVTNSTVVLLQQSVTAGRESGARVARDTYEQSEVSLLGLKNCIQRLL